jgi:hypothetical protein
MIEGDAISFPDPCLTSAITPAMIGMTEHPRQTTETTPMLMQDLFPSDSGTRTTPLLGSPFLLKLDVESVQEEMENDDMVKRRVG